MDDEKRPQKPSREVRITRRSIEDNYTDYLDHEVGYAYEVADVMSQGALAEHDELLQADSARLEQLDLEELDDFRRWAVARAWRRLGEFDRFLEVTRGLLDSSDEHPVVIYSEISRWLAARLADAERIEEARELIDAHLERWPEDLQARELGAVIEYVATEDDEALRLLVEEHPEDAELRFEIAEDLWRFGKSEAAATWLGESSRAAEQSGDTSIGVDIELLRSSIAEEASTRSESTISSE